MRFLFFISLFFFLCMTSVAQTDTIVVHKLSDIEVSAQEIPSAFKSGTPLQSITQKDMLKQGIQSLSDATRRFNGIVLKDYGGIGGLKTIAIRGMGAEHTAISYDGIIVSSVLTGQVDLGRFALDNISGVSLNIGQTDDIFQTARAFASAGVLNLQTINPQLSNNLHSGHVQITGGSFGLFNPMADYARKLNKTFTLAANVNWQRADGRYPFRLVNGKVTTDEKRNNSDINILRTEINLYTDLGKSGQLNTKLYYYDSERGLPGPVIYYNTYSKERLWDKNFFVQTSYIKEFDPKWKLKSQAKYDNIYTRYQNIEAGGNTHNRYKQQEAYLANTLQYTVSNRVSVSAAQDLIYNKLHNEISLFGTNLPYPERYSSLTALAAKYQTNGLTVSGNLLGTYISEKVRNNQPNNTYKKIVPTASFSYAPLGYNNLRIRGSYKHGFRVPTFAELYYPSVYKELKPESAKQLNAGITWMKDFSSFPISFVNITIDAYNNKVENKIVIIPSTFLAKTQNIGDVNIKGVDAQISVHIPVSSKTEIKLTGLYSYMKAIDADELSKTYKSQLPYTPKHSGNATLDFHCPWFDFVYFAVFSGKRYTNLENVKDNRVDGFSDHSISLHKRVKIHDNTFYIQGNILNIWNENYDVIKFYPMPGRSYKLSVGVQF